MNPFASFVPLAQAFGLTVAHSLWQITLIWVVFKLLEWRLNHRHQTIYLLSLTTMLVSVACAIATFAINWERLKPLGQVSSLIENNTVFDPPAILQDGGSVTLTFWESAQFWLENYAAQIGWAWLCCVGLLWLRLIGGWWLAQRLRRHEVSPATTAFQNLCKNWAKRLHINTKVQLLESPHISEPLTLGFWKPVVLFPVGMLLQLSPAQVEVLLLHELAHIRRHDYLVNLFQLGLEVCFFYHPLFWLLSREARSRREFCCDEVVLRHTSDPILYAKTLTDLQLSFLHPSTQFVMNATGKSRFSERILHIVGISPKRSARPNLLFTLMLPAVIALCSWWPPAQKLPTEPVKAFTSYPTDSLPPKQTARPILKVARPGDNNQSLHPTDKSAAQTTDSGEKAQLPSRPNVAVEVVNMNVFYIGVDNPLRIAVADYPSDEIQASLKGAGSITGSKGEYIVRVTQPGEVEIVVKHQVGDKIDFIVVNKYRVKRIPNPTPKLDGEYQSGSVVADLMQQTKGIQLILENFDFDVVCEIVGFEATYLPIGEDPIMRVNSGGSWNSGVLEWIKKAKPGDAYFFDDIQIKCPGDAEPRNVGGLAFKIKAQ